MNQNEKQRAPRKPGRLCAAQSIGVGWAAFDRAWTERAKRELVAAFGRDATARAELTTIAEGDSK